MGFMSFLNNALSSLVKNTQDNQVVQGDDEVTINETIKYEPWRDPYKGRAYTGKLNNNIGSVEIVDFTMDVEGEQYVVFKSGGRCPTDVLNKKYNFDVNLSEQKVPGAQVEFPKIDMTSISAAISKEVPEIAAAEAAASRVEQEKLMKEKYAQMEQAFQNQTVQPHQLQTEPIQSIALERVTYIPPKIDEKPLFNILRKQKSKDILNHIELDLNVPTKELFNVLDDSFENVIEDLIEFIFLPENISNFKESITRSLRNFYDKKEKIDEPENNISE